ncbi:hypothetical protein N656DRAFT_775137 [Canariomyces notabilis]|uniref:Uncharacterized protein n=1 Tax=Canariomyces notabilis TaxID=2074819 RepID=A0AAN6TLM8_9PEZI|nr:hypothetical protein N656DRAFT_775137 [Canariomyces arenarius]
MSVLDLSSAITQHTTDLVSGSWINGDRNAAVGTNFMYFLPVRALAAKLTCGLLER